MEWSHGAARPPSGIFAWLPIRDPLPGAAAVGGESLEGRIEGDSATGRVDHSSVEVVEIEVATQGGQEFDVAPVIVEWTHSLPDSRFDLLADHPSAVADRCAKRRDDRLPAAAILRVEVLV